MNIDPLIANLTVEEGKKSSVYDDATGAYIRPGTHVVGNPTIGVGINIGYPNGLTDDEINTLLVNRVNQSTDQAAHLSYWNDLNEARQMAVVDMIFNLGWDSFHTFNVFSSLLEAGNYVGAADDLETTKWYGQVGQRAVRIAQIIRSGVWVSA